MSPSTATLARPSRDEDFYAWTRDQASALRRLAETRPNVDVDWANLIEEVEDLGSDRRDAVNSQLRRVMEHCLKLGHSIVRDPRRVWLNSVDDARAKVSDKLTKSMRRELEPQLDQLYLQVLRRVQRDLEAYDEADVAATLPPACPFTFDQLIDPDWYPEQRS